MTRMVPTKPGKNAPRGEVEVFEDIQKAEGSDAFVCLHSLGLSRHERKEYAEADFVIIGPPGIFCIEAKGGNVVRSGGVWTIGWPGSSYNSEEGPFAQSEGTTHPLRKHLERELQLNRNDLLIGWGVAFPDIIFDQRGPDWSLDVVYDQRDRDQSFVRFIERLAAHFQARRREVGRKIPPPLSPSRITQIVGALRGDFELVPTIRGLITESRRELAGLSAAQFQVLDFALNERNPKIICDGPAGTGKTLIALEAARRLAREGKKVLLLCFNRQLGRFLALDAAEAGDHVRISTVHAFMGDIIRGAGYGSRLSSLSSGADAFQSEWPDLFEKAAVELLEEERLPQFDVIVIDEAQDVLDAGVMNSLDLVLEGGFRGGHWLICMDSRLQADVYGRMSPEVLAHLRSFRPAEFALRENFRNPKTMVTEMCLVTASDPPICRRSLSSKVDYRVYSDPKDQGRKLRSLLLELLREGVPPGTITVLSGRAREESCIVKYPPDIGKQICVVDDETGRCPTDAISASSVSAFKGLENEIIILTDVPPLAPLTDWNRSILYVGMTRARAKLYLLVDGAFLDVRSRI